MTPNTRVTEDGKVWTFLNTSLAEHGKGSAPSFSPTEKDLVEDIQEKVDSCLSAERIRNLGSWLWFTRFFDDAGKVMMCEIRVGSTPDAEEAHATGATVMQALQKFWMNMKPEDLTKQKG